MRSEKDRLEDGARGHQLSPSFRRIHLRREVRVELFCVAYKNLLAVPLESHVSNQYFRQKRRCNRSYRASCFCWSLSRASSNNLSGSSSSFRRSCSASDDPRAILGWSARRASGAVAVKKAIQRRLHGGKGRVSRVQVSSEDSKAAK